MAELNRSDESDAPFVFVSYAHDDSEAALAIIDMLQLNNVEVWFDDGISPGSRWRDQLAQQISRCSAFIFLSTPRSAASKNCLKEIEFAIDRDRPVFVVHLEAFDVPPGLALAIGDRQAIEKYKMTETRFAEVLITALRGAPGEVTLPHDISADVHENHWKKPRVWAVALGVFALAVLVIGQVQRSQVEQTVEEPPVALQTKEIEARARTSIAVLPFVNFGNEDQEYFSDGISEELLNLLAKTEGLRVAARTSSFNFRDDRPDMMTIGQALNVETVLEGSVRWSGNRLRVTAQLIDVETGYHMWSETYDRKLTDIFAIQDDISSKIVDALQLRLLGTVPNVATSATTDIAAYQLYLQGLRIFSNRDFINFGEALTYLGDSLQIDPTYIPSLTTASNILVIRNAGLLSEEERVRNEMGAKSLLERAAKIDPDNTDYLTALGFYYHMQGDYSQAVTYLQRAIEAAPNNALAMHWLSNALFDANRESEARALQTRALKVDPLSPILLFGAHTRARMRGDVTGMDNYLQSLSLLSPRPWRIYLAMHNTRYLETGDIAAIWPNKSDPKLDTYDHQSWYAAACILLMLDCTTESEEFPVVANTIISIGHPEDATSYVRTALDSDTDLEVMRLQRLVLLGEFEDAYLGFLKIYEEDGAISDQIFNLNGGNGHMFVIWAMMKSGDSARADDLLQKAREKCSPAKNGYIDTNCLHWLMEDYIVTGQSKEALEVMANLQSRTLIHWYYLQRPWFDVVADTSEFQEIWLENIRLMNIERVKLGYEPSSYFERVSLSDLARSRD